MSTAPCKPGPRRAIPGPGVFTCADALAAGAPLSDRTELRAWRLFGAELMPLLEAALAAQGDAPDERLLSLQHSLADLLRSPANTFRSAEHHD